MMHFLRETFAPGPVFTWACVAGLVLIPLVWIVHRGGRARVAVRFSAVALVSRLGATWATKTRFLPPLLVTAAIVAMLVALARPQSPGTYRDTSEGIAILMVLDVSGSMRETDFFLDGQWVRRLDAVKRVLKDFVLGRGDLGGRDNDLIGMTTFAMFADSACPLTLDHATLAHLLDETEIPGWVDGRQVRADQEADYTALGDAIVLAADDLRRAGAQAVAGVPGAAAAKSKVMILLTDGANNPAPFRDAPAAPDPREAAQVAARMGIKVYTIGAVGSQRPQQGFGFFGNRGMQVDEESLKAIAELTGGRYFRATDTDSLRTIYEEIDRLERTETGERVFQDDTRAAKIAMLSALALLLLETLLIHTRYRSIP